MLEYKIGIKSNDIDAAIEEIVAIINLCKEYLKIESSANHLQWDSINSLTSNLIQSEKSLKNKNWLSQHV